MLKRQISPERKAVYRLGQVLGVIGFLTFGSMFVSAALNFGNFDDFEGQIRSMGLRAFGGIAMIIIGGGMAAYGVAGAAGSGLNLDPEQARKDLEPWARMQGGLAKDTLDEMGIDLGKAVDGLANRSAAGRESLEERLRGLHNLYVDGILTEDEYRREKQELLDRT